MISINATLVLQVIHFLILTFILNRIMIRPIMKLIQDRKEYMSKTRWSIEELALESRRLAETYQKQELDAKKRAVSKGNELRNVGLQEVQQISQDCQQKANEMKAKAEEAAREEEQRVSSRLDAEAAILADEITEQVMGRRSGA
jgi:F0F1-type ATP synthase membrane subunit b/b'